MIVAHSLDLRSGFPVQSITIDDSIRGNGNGVLDAGDLGSQVARTNSSWQEHEIDQLRFSAGWDFDNGSRFDAGVDYQSSTMTQRRTQTQQTLGDWGISNPGDVDQYAAGLVEQYCLTCLFDDHTPGSSAIAFKGNAIDLFNALSPVYTGLGNAVGVTGNDFNVVEEEILAVYAQITIEGEFMNMPTTLVTGVRYEDTQVDASALIRIPEAIIWQSDNDFLRQLSDDFLPVADATDYTNLLPSMDLTIQLRDDVVGRVSFSETISRASFGQLYSADSPQAPPRPTILGGDAVGTSGNTSLVPLQSSNFDLSLEWYYGDASYVSVGFFDKRVSNFIGTGQEARSLFGLRDPTSGDPGTRSGDALAELGVVGAEPTDVNLFTMTALIDQLGSVAAASAIFQANFAGGALDQTFVDETLADYDVIANADDPLFLFEVQGPINNNDGNIHGIELAIQHFFGDTGFGVQANYTMVDGDIGIDVGGDPNVDQFALLGLSDTANFTAIYENHGFSARIAYNWRDEFLASANRGSDRNPVFNEAFTQIDLNLTYDVTESLQVSFEAINLTGEDLRTFGRDSSEFWFIQELDPRYLVGARYKF